MTSARVLLIVLTILAAAGTPSWGSTEERGVGDGLSAALGADRFVAGGSVSVLEPVPGDLAAAGGTVDIRAPIGGDVATAGGDIHVNAPIAGDLYAMAGQLQLAAPVQGNVRVAAGTIETAPAAHIGGNVSAAGGNVRIAARIDGYLQVAAEYVYIDAPIEGDADLAGKAIALGPGAHIRGRLRYASPLALWRDPQAQVDGGIERYNFGERESAPYRIQERSGGIAAWIWSAGLAILAILLVVVLPGMYARVTETVRRRWPLSLLIGFIGLVCIPVAALVALLTLIGIPLALAAMAFYFGLLLVGYVSTGITLGHLALRRFKPVRGSGTGWRILAAVLGMLVLSALGRLPWIGGLVVFAALLLGIGALLMQFGGRTNAP